MAGLGKLAQDDFSAGAYPLFARDQVPKNAVEDAINTLISDDGQLYRRGGSVFKGSAFVGLAADPGRWVWDGYLVAGARTAGMLQSSGPSPRLIELDPTDDLTQRDVAPATSLTGSGLNNRKAALLNRVLCMPGHHFWAGADSAAAVPSGVGQITLTKGSTTVVGVGTAWLAGQGAGIFITADSLHVPVVGQVSDATHLELAAPWTGATVVLGAGTWSSNQFRTGFWPQPAAGYESVSQWQIFAAVANKLLAASGGSWPGAFQDPQNRIRMSKPAEPAMFASDDYWDLPAGVQVLGLEPYRDTGVVFSTAGIWAIYNLSLDLTDDYGGTQQRLEELTRDVILWSAPGVASARGQLIVPALDGIYAFNPSGGMNNISGGIAALYRSYVEAGYQAGHATVFGNHYALPIKNGNAVVDLLTCRLEATRRGRRLTAYGWTRQAGYGGNVASLAVRSRQNEKPTLIGMHRTSARILTLPYLTPATAPSDADGSAHQLQVVTREPDAGNGVKNFWEKIRLHYELTDPAAVNPTIAAEYAEDDSAYVALAGAAPETVISAPKFWQLRKRGYGKRIRLTSTGAASKLVIHAIDWFVRPSGRQ